MVTRNYTNSKVKGGEASTIAALEAERNLLTRGIASLSSLGWGWVNVRQQLEAKRNEIETQLAAALA